jgi:hypothetical protein
MGVMRLGFVHLRVTDLEEARNHYSNTPPWTSRQHPSCFSPPTRRPTSPALPCPSEAATSANLTPATLAHARSEYPWATKSAVREARGRSGLCVPTSVPTGVMPW